MVTTRQAIGQPLPRQAILVLGVALTFYPMHHTGCEADCTPVISHIRLWNARSNISLHNHFYTHILYTLGLFLGQFEANWAHPRWCLRLRNLLFLRSKSN
jgi:hypothetical protein